MSEGATQPVRAAQMNGTQMFELIEELYPICRSITGNGLRETLRRIQQEIPLRIEEVASGTQVLDWTVPREWNIRDAYIQDAAGKRVVDFRACNLHVVNYSAPVRRRMTLAQLKPHLHSLPDRPEWIPYRTSYYKEDWGFCLAQSQLDRLQEGEYEVVIDATLEAGHLSYGEATLAGTSDEEILISCHICHPSLCNDNLSGLAVALALYQHVSTLAARRYSYRFLFIPVTIGAITWLARNEAAIAKIRHGLVLSGVGDAAPLRYKRSRRGTAEIDRAVSCVLRDLGGSHGVSDFSPYGYDERQFCSPGFDLPVGRLSRSPFGQYPEYHTSGDNLSFIRAESLAETLTACESVVDLLENNRHYINLSPKGEPQLGKRGLYRAIGGTLDAQGKEMAMLWTLNLSDGEHTLLDIAERSELKFEAIKNASRLLEEHGLLREGSAVSRSPAPNAAHAAERERSRT